MVTTAAGKLFVSTKTYGHEVGLSCAFRQWRAQSHCRFVHGYALAFRFEFAAHTLDANNWVVDFGALKSLQARLVDAFDHKTVVAIDDPMAAHFQAMHDAGAIQLRVLPRVGCEAFAEYAFELADTWLRDNSYKPRVWLRSVEVREHGANSAIAINPLDVAVTRNAPDIVGTQLALLDLEGVLHRAVED